jgi:hypothetical protein
VLADRWRFSVITNVVSSPLALTNKTLTCIFSAKRRAAADLMIAPQTSTSYRTAVAL